MQQLNMSYTGESSHKWRLDARRATVNFLQKTVFQGNTVKYDEKQSNTKIRKLRKSENLSK